ncbi:MAG: hypothetical protein ACP5M9_00635 [Candidatus Micrarchaeia archaeon]
MELSENAKLTLSRGKVKLRVLRSGMYQQITFDVKVVSSGNIEYNELFTNRTIDISELKRIADEIGLPIAAQNAIVFPEGTSSNDFKIREKEYHIAEETNEVKTEELIEEKSNNIESQNNNSKTQEANKEGSSQNSSETSNNDKNQ